VFNLIKKTIILSGFVFSLFILSGCKSMYTYKSIQEINGKTLTFASRWNLWYLGIKVFVGTKANAHFQIELLDGDRVFSTRIDLHGPFEYQQVYIGDLYKDNTGIRVKILDLIEDGEFKLGVDISGRWAEPDEQSKPEI